MRRLRLLTMMAVVSAALAAAPRARAQSDEDALHVEAAASLTYAALYRSSRSPRSENAFGASADLRLHPWSRHGVYATAFDASGLFGPRLTLVSMGYTFRLAGEELFRFLTPIFRLDVGPALGVVELADHGVSFTHEDLGVRTAATLDARLWHVLLGLQGSYQAGAPIHGTGGSPAEGGFVFGVRIGGDVGLARRH